MVAAQTTKCLSREEAIAAEVDRLTSLGYGEPFGIGTVRHNGRTLTVAECATLNVDRSGEFAAKVRDMAKSGVAPGSCTDREQFAGVGTLADQFKGREDRLAELVADAKRRGYTPNDHDMYIDAFDDKRGGNPRAFINPSGGRTQIRRTCEALNLPSTGLVNVKAREVDVVANRKPKKPLADDVAQRFEEQYLRNDPSLAVRLSRRELRQMVYDRHGPQKPADSAAVFTPAKKRKPKRKARAAAR